MNISDLKAGTGSVSLEANVIKMEDTKEITKFGKTLRVANAVLKDKTGTIKIALWNYQIDKVDVGSKVKIENGYVNEWQNEPQLTLGKFGKLTVL